MVVVVVEFPTMKQAREWYESEAYLGVIRYRKESCEGWVTLCNGFSIQQVGE
jgi:uncharacterized protein (DUF1330 family)